jgi:hypothetical protein
MKVSHYLTINVAVLPKPIMVITPLKVNVKKGASLTIECTSTYPNIANIEKGSFQKIKWKRNNKFLDESAASKFHYSICPRVLMIQDFRHPPGATLARMKVETFSF